MQVPLYIGLTYGTTAISLNVAARRNQKCKMYVSFLRIVTIHRKEFGVSAQTTHQLDLQRILPQVGVTSVRSNWLRHNLRFGAPMHIVHIVDH